MDKHKKLQYPPPPKPQEWKEICFLKISRSAEDFLVTEAENFTKIRNILSYCHIITEGFTLHLTEGTAGSEK